MLSVWALGAERSSQLRAALAAELLLFVATGILARLQLFGSWSPVSLASWSLTLYCVPVAASLWVGAELFDLRLLEGDGLALACVLSAIGHAGFMLPVALRLHYRGQQVKHVAATVRPNVIAAFALAGIGAIAGVKFAVFDAGISAIESGSYADRYLLMSGQGPTLALLPFWSVGMLALLLHFVRARRVVPAFAILCIGLSGLLLWTGLIGSKSLFVQLLLSSLFIVHAEVRRLPAVLLGAIVLGGIAAATLHSLGGRTLSLDVFALAREANVAILNPANTEFGAAAATIADVAQAVPAEVPYRWGSTYLLAFPVLVPKFIWPARPLAPGEWYAARFYPDVWEAGGAWAFSPIAEALLNFGVVGVFALLFVIGAVLTSAEYLLSVGTPAGEYRTLILASLFPQMLLFGRLDSVSFIKGFGLSVLAGLVVLRVLSGMLAVRASLPPPEEGR